jgi:hypothetical protein
MNHDEIEARLHATGRNDACPCGSGKKYKKCHLNEDEAAVHAQAARLASIADASAEAKQNKAAPGDHSKGRSKDAAVAAKGGRTARPTNLPRRRAV